jgi:quinol monooxygenase YgiN
VDPLRRPALGAAAQMTADRHWAILKLSLFVMTCQERIMVYVNVLLTVRDARDVDEIGSLLAEQCRLSRAEPGCRRFEVYHSQSDARVFLLNEHWESQQALETHRQAKAFKTIYEPKILPRVDRVPHPSVLVE